MDVTQPCGALRLGSCRGGSFLLRPGPPPADVGGGARDAQAGGESAPPDPSGMEASGGVAHPGPSGAESQGRAGGPDPSGMGASCGVAGAAGKGVPPPPPSTAIGESPTGPRGARRAPAGGMCSSPDSERSSPSPCRRTSAGRAGSVSAVGGATPPPGAYTAGGLASAPRGDCVRGRVGALPASRPPPAANTLGSAESSRAAPTEPARRPSPAGSPPLLRRWAPVFVGAVPAPAVGRMCLRMPPRPMSPAESAGGEAGPGWEASPMMTPRYPYRALSLGPALRGL